MVSLCSAARVRSSASVSSVCWQRLACAAMVRRSFSVNSLLLLLLPGGEGADGEVVDTEDRDDTRARFEDDDGLPERPGNHIAMVGLENKGGRSPIGRERDGTPLRCRQVLLSKNF